LETRVGLACRSLLSESQPSETSKSELRTGARKNFEKKASWLCFDLARFPIRLGYPSRDNDLERELEREFLGSASFWQMDE